MSIRRPLATSTTPSAGRRRAPDRVQHQREEARDQQHVKLPTGGHTISNSTFANWPAHAQPGPNESAKLVGICADSSR